MTEPCITEAIWQSAVAEGHDLHTAQGRAALDRRLRSELAKIEDDSLRSHAADIIRQNPRQLVPSFATIMGILGLENILGKL